MEPEEAIEFSCHAPYDNMTTLVSRLSNDFIITEDMFLTLI